eukprot:scaffold4636_cov81-Isochrysis_galbana.AAC.1
MPGWRAPQRRVLAVFALAALPLGSSAPVEAAAASDAREPRKSSGGRDTSVGALAGGADAAAIAAACCWSYNQETKRYQFYVKPAEAAACVAPYKPAACPAKPPPPAAATAARTPPPPPPVAVATAVPVAAAVAATPVVTAPLTAAAPINPTAAPVAAAAASLASPPPPPPAAAAAAAGSVPKSPAFKLGSKGAAKASAASPAGDGAGHPTPATGGFLFGLVKFVLLAGAIFSVWAFRTRLCARLGDFFPSGDDKRKSVSLAAGAKPPKDMYKRVESARSDRDETLSQTSCGLAEEEIDAAAEEWAARLAAQREGREYVPSGGGCTAVM